MTTFPRYWRTIRAKHLYRVVDERLGTQLLPLLAVSIHHGVVRRDSLTDDESRADDLSNYKRCAAGDVVINRMRAFQGAIGIAPEDGIVSPDYLVLRLVDGLERRFFHHLFRSAWFVGEMSARLRGIGGSDQGNVRTPRINVEDFGEIPLALPSRAEQHLIAGFLDAETARVDELIKKKLRMIERLNERFDAAVYLAVTRGVDRESEVRAVRIPWIERMPRHWGLPSVGANYEVQLGKMLNPAAADGPRKSPYLRNVNVQWDRVVLDDLLEMHFDDEERHRLKLRPGDLLVCEGGEVGRAAIWHGELEPCFFQKAIHRVRPLREGNTRFLMYCLRAAAKRSVFSVEGNQSTIVHLTAEQLRAHRLPWPPLAEQEAIVARLDRGSSECTKLVGRLERQIDLLREHRQALITAAVTGEFDVARTAA